MSRIGLQTLLKYYKFKYYVNDDSIAIRKRFNNYYYEQIWFSDRYVASWVAEKFTIEFCRDRLTSLIYKFDKIEVNFIIEMDNGILLYNNCLVIVNDQIRTLTCELIDNFNYTWEQIIEYGSKIVLEAVNCAIRDLKTRFEESEK